MQRTANENAACKRRIYKRSDQPKIDNSKQCKELVAVFSDIILQKRVLDAGQLFPSSHVWNDRPSFQRKKFIG